MGLVFVENKLYRIKILCYLWHVNRVSDILNSDEMRFEWKDHFSVPVIIDLSNIALADENLERLLRILIF